MPGAVATAYVKLIPTFDGKLSSSISKEVGKVDGKSAGSKVGKLFTNGVSSGMSGLKTSMTSRFSAATVAVGNIAAKAFTAVASVIASTFDAAINRVDTMNNFPRIMEGMGIGADEANAAVKRLSAGIDGLPTALDDAVSGVTRFTSKNGDVAKSTDYFLAVNNAIAAGGQSMQIQTTALEQLSQSYSKGRMDMMEWRSLQQAMPAQLNQVAKAMGTTADALGEGLRNGSISMDDFLDKIVELNDEGVDGLDSFAEQARKATGGIGTAMTNVKNRISKAVSGIIDAIGQENIAGAINAFSSKFGKIASILGGKDLDGNTIGFIGGLKRGLESVLDGWKPKFKVDWDALFGKAIEAAEKFGEVLSGPISRIIEFVDGSLAGISQTVSTVADMAARTITPFFERITPGLESIGKMVDDFFKPIGDFLQGNGPAFERMMENIGVAFETMAPALESLADHFNSLMKKLEPIAGPIGEAVASTLSIIFSTIAGLGSIAVSVLDTLVGIIDTLVGIIAGAVENFGWFLVVIGALPPEVQGGIDSVDGLSDSINNIPNREVDVKANVTGEDKVWSLFDAIRGLSDKYLEVGVNATPYATGGYANTPFIPRHAAGYIAKGPTLTNNGWVGEDGAEAVLNWGTGGAVVPLTNRRYMEPIAEAIARNMVGGSTQSYNLYIDGAVVNDDPAIRSMFIDFMLELKRKGAMNVG